MFPLASEQCSISPKLVLQRKLGLHCIFICEPLCGNRRVNIWGKSSQLNRIEWSWDLCKNNCMVIVFRWYLTYKNTYLNPWQKEDDYNCVQMQISNDQPLEVSSVSQKTKIFWKKQQHDTEELGIDTFLVSVQTSKLYKSRERYRHGLKSSLTLKWTLERDSFCHGLSFLF